ncbi:hypothetical protein CAEBREN_15105 [Caenorhabditis brenneri]|uniref:Uncharacterized protein n=1 Tax=Caenorhabditis brenneri TaxID=135651 RepID=G0PHD1_CAEBE|nr:hypothetical protein CAEBREN_15105 [Caenorhabditis brenneri]
MKFGTSFVLFATISMMFAFAYAEDEAPAVVATTAATAEAAVTGAVGGGADATPAASGEVTGKSGGAAVEVSTAAPPVISSVAPTGHPSVETTTKGSTSFATQLFAVGALLLAATL